MSTVEMHKYPYGMLMDGGAKEVHPFKYSGKELDRMHGLNMYDHGARMYDPAALLWTGVDELAEKHPEMSPYVMCADNPVNLVDMDGRDWYQAADGSAFWEDSHEDMIFVGETAYTNVGARYTISYESSDYSLTFEQNSIVGTNQIVQNYGKNHDVDKSNNGLRVLMMMLNVYNDVSGNGFLGGIRNKDFQMINKTFNYTMLAHSISKACTDIYPSIKGNQTLTNDNQVEIMKDVLELLPFGWIYVIEAEKASDIFYNNVIMPTDQYFNEMFKPPNYYGLW